MIDRSVQPQMPASAYETYAIVAPLSSHFRPATCEEAGCPAFLNGWRSVIDVSIDGGPERHHFITHDASRRHTVVQDGPSLFTFTFPPGQRCFAASEHRVRLDREERFVKRGGDFRGNPLGLRPVAFKDPQAWVDDFGEHQERVATLLERG